MLSNVLSQVDFRWKLLATASLCAILAGVYYLYHVMSQPSFDGLMVRVLAQTATIDSYEERAETDVSVSKRRLLIAGVYKIDLKAHKFSSDSTTTLVALQGSGKAPSGVFSLRNVSLGDDVYYRVATKSTDLAYILSGGSEWHHYVKGSIPPEVTEVAVSGPILDDLALFRSGETYLNFDRKVGTFGSTTQYLLHLSGVSGPSEGPLHDLISRVGLKGHIDLWVDETSANIKSVHFSGEDYESTTTIINLRHPQEITAPLL